MRYLVPFRDINVHASTSHYAFTSASSPSAQTLVVERPSGDIRLNDRSLLGAKRVSSIAGILGIIQLRLDKYIVVITKAQPVGRIKTHMVYKVIATEFLPLRERILHDPDEDIYLGLLKTLLKNAPMYFSYSFDLTNSFQRQTDSNPSLALWQRADDRFFWNKFIQSDLINFATGATSASGLRHHGSHQTAADPFILPVIFGMLRITTTRIKATPLTFVLITRRSRHRAGTRYMTRGIDEHGHVANFNETEQIVVLNDGSNAMGGMEGGGGMQNGKIGGFQGQDAQVMSYVQTRGSVPVYWAEINTLRYVPDLQIRGVETAVGAAKQHFDEQIRLYGDNYLVNLVNQRGREDRVKEAYEQLVRTLVSGPNESTQADYVTDEKIHVVEASQSNQEYDRLHYVYFDFHNETKGLRWHRAQLLLDQLKNGLVQGQYFRGLDMPGDAQGRLEVRNRQTAVVRTNCMDCLDRTNVIQTMLARWILTRQLLDMGVLKPGESADDDRAFRTLFQNVWADNADVVSRSYSGTGALKTDFTRTGQRTRAGMVQDLNNSITRYVKNNFSDGPRQDAFDLFLGAFHPDSSGAGPSLVFVDRRPLLIQSIPYILATSLFMVIVASFARSTQGSSPWPLRLFTFVWIFVGIWCFNFIRTHGVLYVNWPKLNTPRWANEGYQETMGAIRKDRFIGPLVARHERGASNARRYDNIEQLCPRARCLIISGRQRRTFENVYAAKQTQSENTFMYVACILAWHGTSTKHEGLEDMPRGEDSRLHQPLVISLPVIILISFMVKVEITASTRVKEMSSTDDTIDGNFAEPITSAQSRDNDQHQRLSSPSDGLSKDAFISNNSARSSSQTNEYPITVATSSNEQQSGQRSQPSQISNVTSLGQKKHTRPNKYHGPASTWRDWTASERQLAASLDQLQAKDLSIHLYNAFWLKRRAGGSNEQQAESQQEASKSTRLPDKGWQPPEDWTAWPLHPDDVPRESENCKWEDESDKEVKVTHGIQTSSEVLQDLLVARVLKKAKERLCEREWEAPGHGIQAPPIDPWAENPGRIAGLAGDPKNPKETEVLHMADDQRAKDIMQPLINHLLGKLDALLIGLHHARSSYATYNKTTESIHALSDEDVPRKYKRRKEVVRAATS
ncbi:MAG: hypothetical protein Q9228_006946, partial [Teloschistes exilis]